MQSEYIINGITYRKVEEPKEEKRLEGWIKKKYYLNSGECSLTKKKKQHDDTLMIEIREGERILSRDDVLKALNEYHVNEARILEELGFDE